MKPKISTHTETWRVRVQRFTNAIVNVSHLYDGVLIRVRRFMCFSQNMRRHSPHSRTGCWIIRGERCTDQPLIGQHGEALANHVSASSGGKTHDIKINCHLFAFFSSAIFGRLNDIFFFFSFVFLQRGLFRVARDENKRLKRLTMILWRLLLMCVTSALRAASSQTQEGRSIIIIIVLILMIVYAFQHFKQH